MESAIKNAITQQVPSYAKAMADYESSMALKADLESSFSLKPNASPRTTYNKLNNAFKNERDVGKIHELAKATNGQILPRIAGNNLNSITPKGLSKYVASAGGFASAINPATWATTLPLLLSASPRVLGETSHSLGRLTRQTEKTYSKTDKAMLAAIIAGHGKQTADDANDNFKGKALAKALQSKRIGQWLEGLK
jgi:hypothetical protein